MTSENGKKLVRACGASGLCIAFGAKGCGFDPGRSATFQTVGHCEKAVYPCLATNVPFLVCLSAQHAAGDFFFLLKFQTPVTLYISDLWSILVARLAHSARRAEVSASPCVLCTKCCLQIFSFLFIFYFYFFIV